MSEEAFLASNLRSRLGRIPKWSQSMAVARSGLLPGREWVNFPVGIR